MNKYTKGPWAYSTTKGANRKHLNHVTIASDFALIATFDCTFEGYPESDDEIEANVRLIAAAPELLEALESAYNLLLTMGAGEDWGQLEYYKKVILKAKGE